MADAPQGPHGFPEDAADVPGPKKKTTYDFYAEGLERDPRHWADNRLQSLIASSVFSPEGYAEVVKNPSVTTAQKLAYIAGRATHDLITDGSRIPYWALNHPLAQVSVFGEMASQAAGLTPDYAAWRDKLEKEKKEATKPIIDSRFAQEMGFFHGNDNRGKIPFTLAANAIPAAGALVLNGLSNNTNYLNILGGGRTAGFQAVMPADGSLTESSNPLLELGARYLFGRTGRVLPWEQFTAERPDVSEADYKAYAAHQFDKGPLGIGLVRATSRNLDAEPEFTMMGYRVPFSAATATIGSMAGAIAGSHIANNMVNTELARRINLPKEEGPRRLAGALLGAVLGAGVGKGTGAAVNHTILQPVLNPERVAEAEAWRQQQQALGLL